MPSREIRRFKVGTHELALTCCEGPGACASGGGTLTVSEPVEKGDVERNSIVTCFDASRVTDLRDGLDEVLEGIVEKLAPDRALALLNHEIEIAETRLARLREKHESLVHH